MIPIRCNVILLLGVILVASDRAFAQDEVDRLIAQLGGEDTQARYDAYRRLRAHKTPAVLAARPLAAGYGTRPVTRNWGNTAR